MSDPKTKRLTVYLPDRVKSDLSAMAEQTGLSMTQLIVMATHGMLAHYKAAGGAIFAGLIDAGGHAANANANANAFGARLDAIARDASDLQRYYGARASEYESVYERDDPGYREELAHLSARIVQTVRNRSVLELACGTGYWTEKAAGAASRIVGVDIRPEVIEIAESKRLPGTVRFMIGDAYKPESIPGQFDAALACFWLSHVPKNKLSDFLARLHARLGSGAAVFMADNVYVEGRGGPLIVKEDAEDTYKLRTLADGTQHEIVKNYYTERELRELFEPVSRHLTVFAGGSFWFVSYTTR
ncbi:class I SAM-dependent methyltransferase [Paenibacillus sp. GYB003]|uniref:class I SAM-dependent methyltransferase n=1 Tax=Paenibacillus sp. GYB003 TaxID=2994392 RepID=UPI002F96908F